MTVSDKLFEKVAERLDGLPAVIRDVAEPALDRLREAAPSIDRVGERAIRDGLSFLSVGRGSDAKAVIDSGLAPVVVAATRGEVRGEVRAVRVGGAVHAGRG